MLIRRKKTRENMNKYLDFLWVMTEREIKARYKRAIFGFLWVLLNPLLQMTIIGLIFSLYIRIPDYFLFLFTGLLPWQFFLLSVTKTTPSFVNERSLLQKTKFSKEVIPISMIFSNFIHLLISLFLLGIFLLLTNKLLFPEILIMLPALVWLLMFTIGLSLITSSLQVRFRDINFFIQSALILWFYITPIIYNLSIIPDSLHKLFLINPLTSIFELFHMAILNQGLINVQLMMTNLVISMVVICVGIYIFIRESPYFVDWL